MPTQTLDHTGLPFTREFGKPPEDSLEAELSNGKRAFQLYKIIKKKDGSRNALEGSVFQGCIALAMESYLEANTIQYDCGQKGDLILSKTSWGPRQPSFEVKEVGRRNFKLNIWPNTVLEICGTDGVTVRGSHPKLDLALKELSEKRLAKEERNSSADICLFLTHVGYTDYKYLLFPMSYIDKIVLEMNPRTKEAEFSIPIEENNGEIRLYRGEYRAKDLLQFPTDEILDYLNIMNKFLERPGRKANTVREKQFVRLLWRHLLGTNSRGDFGTSN